MARGSVTTAAELGTCSTLHQDAERQDMGSSRQGRSPPHFGSSRAGGALGVPWRPALPSLLLQACKSRPPTYSKYSAAGVVPNVSLRRAPSLALPAWASEQLGLFHELLQCTQGSSTEKEAKR